jgi:dipeptidyl aminopeptidase/acylaminoacyl peptidase
MGVTWQVNSINDLFSCCPRISLTVF